MIIIKKVSKILQNDKKMKYPTALNISIKQEKQINIKNHQISKFKSKNKVIKNLYYKFVLISKLVKLFQGI